MLAPNQNPGNFSAGQIPPWKNPNRPENQPTQNPPGESNLPYRSDQTPAAPRYSGPVPAAPTRPNPNFHEVQTPPGVEKDWGPLRPIRKLPKPSQEKVTYVLTKAQRMDIPGEASSRRRWTIAGSIIAILVIGGGTTAFIFFGRQEQGLVVSNQPIIFSNTNTNTNANTNSTENVFPLANDNTNQANININLDSDADGLTDAQEKIYSTNANNPDTDGDGFLDGAEVSGGYDPLKGGGAKLAK
jgi:hypothetical protein